MKSLFLKRVLLGVSLTTLFVLAGEQFSMSAADKKMYEELKENNPAEMDIEAGMELFEKLGDEAALAKFLEVDKKKLANHIAGFPRYVKKLGNVVGLDQVLQALQVERRVKKYALDSEEMTSLLGYVKSLANDIPINIDVNANDEMKKSLALGKEIYMTRRGYRGLSCNSCHSHPGSLLRTQVLPELGAQNTGGTWPAYRMTLSKMVTLQERARTCMRDAGQKLLPLGSKEMVGLEVYITNLAKDKKQVVEIPGLKR